MTKPATSPKPLRAYTYGPPVCGQRADNLQNVSASRIAPHNVTPQPSRLAAPYGASEAGSRNTPLPIMLPTTRAIADHRPSGRAAGAAWGVACGAVTRRSGTGGATV